MPRLPAHERRAQLIDIGTTCFAARGYHATTTAELARAAGVAEPILYRHFPEKRSYFREVVKDAGDTIATQWRERLAPDDATDALRRAALLDGPFHGAPDAAVRVVLDACTIPDDRPLRNAVRTVIGRWHSIATDACVRLDRADPEAIAWLVIDTHVGFALLSPAHGAMSRTAHGHSVTGALQSMIQG